MSAHEKYDVFIGLEIHIHLRTESKMFCSCPARYGDDPNTNVCPVCLWMPGALPILSENVLEKATLACLSLNCDIQEESAFDQKVYYYPDLPKGFQLSQAHKPLAAARHDDIDVILHAHQFTHRRTVGRLNDLHHVCRQPGLGQALVDKPGYRLVGVNGFRTTAQNGGIARLQAQPGRVGTADRLAPDLLKPLHRQVLAVVAPA